MAKLLTAVGCVKLKPAAVRREVPDVGAPGLHLVIQPSGVKSWALRYRRTSGKGAKLTLGPFYFAGDREPDMEPAIGAPLTLAQARWLAAQLRHEIATGIDVGVRYLHEKRAKRSALATAQASTYGALAREYVETHVCKRVRRWPEIARLLGIDAETSDATPDGLAERWRTRPVAEIDGHDIWAVIDEARKIGIPGVEARTDGPSDARATHLLAALSGFFGWLQRERRVTVNPCAGVFRPAPAKARDRVLSNDEIARFWRACETLPLNYGAVLKILALTGARLREVTDMRWSELAGDEWRLPSERVKNGRAHIVPLAPLAREILASVPRIEGCEFVFSNDGTRPPGGWSRVKLTIDSAMGNPPPWVLHDLRRTFVTGLGELGVRPDVIELAVNHAGGSRGGIAGVYNRSELLPERRAALERWAAHISGLAEGRGNVVSLARA